MEKTLLDAIQARTDAATEGPWEIIGGNEYLTGIDVAIGSRDEGGIRLQDAEFIANARTHVPALLAYARDLEARIATAKSDALREAAERFKARSDTYQKTMQEMADSHEYSADIVRYGAYSAEANTTATWLRTRAALTATEGQP